MTSLELGVSLGPLQRDCAAPVFTSSREDGWSGINQWPAAAFSALPWAMAAAACIYVKYRIMEGTESYNSGGFVTAGASIGRPETLIVKLSFFREDILLVFLFIPVALILVARLLPARLRLPTIGVFSALITIALFLQLRAYEEVGRFLSFRALRTALSWGLHEPGAYVGYLRSETLAAAGVSLIVGTWILRSTARRIRNRQHRPSERTSYIYIPRIAIPCLLVGLVLPWLPQVNATPFHRAILFTAMGDYWHERG